jgi:hypothetical protein
MGKVQRRGGEILQASGSTGQRDRYVIAEQPALAPHPAHPGGCAALHIVLVTVLRFSRSCELFPDRFGGQGASFRV